MSTQTNVTYIRRLFLLRLLEPRNYQGFHRKKNTDILTVSPTKQNKSPVYALQELTSTINLEKFPCLPSLSLMLNFKYNKQHSVVEFWQNWFSTLSRSMKVILFNHYIVVLNIRQILHWILSLTQGNKILQQINSLAKYSSFTGWRGT